MHSRAGWCGVARLRASKLAAALHSSWQSPSAVPSTSRLAPVADVPLSVAPESKTTPSILRRRSPWRVNDWPVTQGRRLVQTSVVGGGKRRPSLTNNLLSCPPLFSPTRRTRTYLQPALSRHHSRRVPLWFCAAWGPRFVSD